MDEQDDGQRQVIERYVVNSSGKIVGFNPDYSDPQKQPIQRGPISPQQVQSSKHDTRTIPHVGFGIVAIMMVAFIVWLIKFLAKVFPVWALGLVTIFVSLIVAHLLVSTRWLQNASESFVRELPFQKWLSSKAQSSEKTPNESAFLASLRWHIKIGIFLASALLLSLLFYDFNGVGLYAVSVYILAVLLIVAIFFFLRFSRAALRNPVKTLFLLIVTSILLIYLWLHK